MSPRHVGLRCPLGLTPCPHKEHNSYVGANIALSSWRAPEDIASQRIGQKLAPAGAILHHLADARGDIALKHGSQRRRLRPDALRRGGGRISDRPDRLSPGIVRTADFGVIGTRSVQVIEPLPGAAEFLHGGKQRGIGALQDRA